MFVLLLDLTFKSGTGLTSSCSAGLKPYFFSLKCMTFSNFLLLFLYSTEHSRIQLNFIQYECTCTFTYFWTTEYYQHTGIFDLEYTLLHVYIYIATILVVFSYFHLLRPPLLFQEMRTLLLSENHVFITCSLIA
jgi:hypothetical protein